MVRALALILVWSLALAASPAGAQSAQPSPAPVATATATAQPVAAQPAPARHHAWMIVGGVFFAAGMATYVYYLTLPPHPAEASTTHAALQRPGLQVRIPLGGRI